MIVDTSALVAIARKEEAYERLRRAILQAQVASVPSPVLVEYARVTARHGRAHDPEAAGVLRFLMETALTVESFTAEDASLAVEANAEHGIGNGRGGTLNFGDLLVYAIAKRLRRPILCTGGDFAATGIALHPASRA